ncbi:MAG: hypothetical protein WA639_13310 [Candidatus Acidiferrum sp.]
MNSSLLTELHTYECDALAYLLAMPRAVLLPDSTAEVQAILRICQREKISLCCARLQH